LEPDVSFERLSCVVIDEQQRFGVEQRATLVGKGKGCDVLSCTATPIPRSLALALYGDLTLSYLHVRPAATAPRTTKVCHFQEEGIAYDAIPEALDRGEQAYIICPLIGIETASLDGPAEPDVEDEAEAPAEVEYAYVEWGLESGEFDDAGAVTKAATTHAKVLSESIFPNARVGLLHGKLSSAEKVQIMQDFSEGHIDILVSTTVVEVGVDVPNATVMVIEDADRFGLAQLHQLRGRVGRGQKPGQVFLVSRSLAPNALERLSSLERIDDGFELSEQDLSMRREGDVFGGRQHGKSPLKLVNVVRDAKVVEAAQADARAIQEGTLVSDDERSIILREAERLELER
jgi:ATP-dependent DNA helicase RecG